MLPNEILLIIYEYSDTTTRINLNLACKWNFKVVNPYKDSIIFSILKCVIGKTHNIDKHKSVIIFNILKYIRRLRKSRKHRIFFKYILNDETRWLDTKIKYELFLECIKSQCMECF